MVNALEAKNLEEVVYGGDVGPSEEVCELVKSEVTDKNRSAVSSAKVTAQSFKTKDASARMLLTCCMDDKHLDIVKGCKTSRQIWEKLRVEYQDKSSNSYHQLLKEFYSCKKLVNQSVSEYVAKVEAIASKLRELGHPQDNSGYHPYCSRSDR